MSTTLFLIRHAKPENPNPQIYPYDALRPLTEEGRQIQHAKAELLLQQGITFPWILCSPFLRAKQTAAILFETLGSRIEVEPSLGEDFNAAHLLTRIAPHMNSCFVGHIPTLEYFARELVGFDCLPEGLSKSGMVIVEFKDAIEFGAATFIEYVK